MTERGSLRLRRVGKQYPVKGHELEVLRNITLDVEPGSFISIVGASGCGKSTLLRLIIGLDAAFDGQILLDGEAIHGTSLRRGIVFQDHRLLPWLTLWENIGLSLENVDWPHSRKREAIYHAAYLDPHTSAELSLDDIRKLCDDLIEAHGTMMPKFS